MGYAGAVRWAGMPTRVNLAGRLRVPPEWHLGPERSQAWRDLDLWYLVDGHGHVDTEHERIAIGPGSCLLMRGGEAYTFARARGTTFTHFYVHFDYLDRGRRCDHRHLALPTLHRHLDDPGVLVPLLERCVAAWRGERGTESARWLDAVLLELDHQERRAADAGTDPRTAAIDALCAAMRDQPEADHRIADHAARLGLSRSQLTRLFTARTGRAPRRYLTEQRMRTAALLLGETSLAVRRIAEQLGYRDVHFFSRHFKAHHGLSPSAFRER